MHILIIASWYKKSIDEIHAPFIEEQARMLMNSGIKVGVFHPYFMGGFKEKLRGNKKIKYNYIDNGLPTWYYGEMSVVPYLRKIIYNHICKHAEKIFLEYVKEKGKPDILHAHSVFMGGVVANYLSVKYKIPYVITEHASKLITEYKIQNKDDIAYVKKILNNSNSVIFVSWFQANEMKEKYKLNIFRQSIISNSLNPLFKFKHSTDKPDPIIIAIIGNLTINKNHILLFNAVKILKAEGINCIVKVIGDGDLKPFLEKFVIANNLEKEIILLGILSRQKVYNELVESHCLVSVSRFETFGINIIEALAVGRPVIATDSGGSKEIINSENGILLNSFDTNELNAAIRYLIKNFDKLNQQEISSNCINKYSEDIILDKLMKVYNEILR